MKIVAVLAFIFLVASAGAQNAKVVALDAQDAAKAKELEQKVTDALKARADFNNQIEKKYLQAAAGEDYLIIEGQFHLKHGWEGGFEYSENFQFIVPVVRMIPTAGGGSGCLYVTPVTGGLSVAN
jgi:hypothetical protein